MANEQVQVSVAASEYAVMQALVKVTKDVKAAVKAGGGVVVEAAAIGAAVVADLAPALAKVGQLEGDAAADPVAAERAVAMQLPDLVDAIRS